MKPVPPVTNAGISYSLIRRCINPISIVIIRISFRALSYPEFTPFRNDVSEMITLLAFFPLM